MYAKKYIDSSIDLIRKVLGDTNNELSSEQRSKLEKGIRDLKKLQNATKLSHRQVSLVVGKIAKTVYQILKSGSNE